MIPNALIGRTFAFIYVKTSTEAGGKIDYFYSFTCDSMSYRIGLAIEKNDVRTIQDELTDITITTNLPSWQFLAIFAV